MPFTIQSNDVAANPDRQSVWYDTDIAILALALAGYGVRGGGCGVWSQGEVSGGSNPDDMTVYVTSGQVSGWGVVFDASGDSALAVDAADATYPRIDLVCLNSDTDGIPRIQTGVPAASPKPPDLTTEGLEAVALAFIDVPAGATAITQAMITDKRVTLVPPSVRIAEGVPDGAPYAGEQLVAVDTTPTTGGIYVWDGAAWVKAASI
jgi:hypothetical protein